MKSKIIFSLILVLSILSISLPIMAIEPFIDTFDLTCWYSDSSSIYFWSASSLDVYTNPYESELSNTTLRNYVTTGFDRWNPATEISNSYTSSQSAADVSVIGLSRESAHDAGIPDSAVGAGFYNREERTLVGKGIVNGSTKNVYLITGPGHLYYVWEDRTEELSSSDWQKVFVHEMGHILGYIGHYDNGAVMKTELNDITTTYPNTNEKNHLAQVN